MKKFLKKLNEFFPQSMQMNNPGIKDPGIKTNPTEKPKRGVPFIKPSPNTKPEASIEDLIDKFADSIMEVDETQGLENIPEYRELISLVFGNDKPVINPPTTNPPKIQPKRQIPFIKPSPDTKPEAYRLGESFKLRSFSQFVNEARHEDNPAFPEEYKRGWMQAISDNARQLQQRIGGRPIQLPMPSLIQMIGFIQSGYEKDLEKLAEDIIVEFYGSLLDNVELRIKLGAPPKSMQDELEKEMITPEDITDRRTIGEIHRRKVGRMMMQSEAKGSKQLFNFAVERLTDLFASKNLNSGQNRGIASQIEQLMTRHNLDLGQIYIILLNQLGDIADISDLTVPEFQMAGFWKGGSPAGMVQVSWESGDEEKDEDAAQKVLDSLEAGEEPDLEDVEEFFDGDKAIIKVYGNDFGMLLHETIKGIWKLIVNSALPSDPGTEEMVTTILRNTDDIYNEIHELKFGNRFKQSISEFINTRFSTQLTVSLDSGKRVTMVPVDDVPNFKERLFGMMIIEPNPYTFIKMIIAILSKDYSRKGMTKIDMHAYNVVKMEAEYEAQMLDFDLDQGSQFNIPTSTMTNTPRSSGNLEDMSGAELKQMMINALEEEDYTLAARIRDILKTKGTNESRKYSSNRWNRF